MTILEIENKGLLLYKVSVKNNNFNVDLKYKNILVYIKPQKSELNINFYKTGKNSFFIEKDTLCIELPYYCNLLYEGSLTAIESLFVKEYNILFIHNSFKPLFNCKNLFLNNNFYQKNLSEINKKLVSFLNIYNNIETNNFKSVLNYTHIYIKTMTEVAPTILPLTQFIETCILHKDMLYARYSGNKGVYFIYSRHNSDNSKINLAEDNLTDKLFCAQFNLATCHYKGIAIINNDEWTDYKRKFKNIILKADELFCKNKTYDGTDFAICYKHLYYIENFYVYSSLTNVKTLQLACRILELLGNKLEFNEAFKLLSELYENLNLKLKQHPIKSTSMDYKSLEVIVNCIQRDVIKTNTENHIKN
jgi:hypothetical protein